MNKRLLVIFLYVGLTLSVCPASIQLENLEANSLTFNIAEEHDESSEETFTYNMKENFLQRPSAAFGIQSIDTKNSQIKEFYIKVLETTKKFCRIIFKKQIETWKSLKIFFMLSNNPEIALGSVNTAVGSLKGNKKTSGVYLSQEINPRVSIARTFLNGFSVNQMKSIQISLSKQAITLQNKLEVEIITGPEFDLKQIWYSFIIFSPTASSFASFGRTYQEVLFRGFAASDIMDLIPYSTYKFLGISLLSILSVDKGINLSAGITEDFVLFLNSTQFIEKITVNYIVLGKTPKEICQKCYQTNVFMNQCFDQCPKGTYRYKFPRKLGYGCRRCSSQLNEELNDEATGCQCMKNSLFKSGKCEKISPQLTFQEQAPSLQENTNNAEQIYQISQNSVTNNCSKFKNTYWTGYRCACLVGFIPLLTGCQSFQQYIKSLTYSSSLYPSQQLSKPASTPSIAQNPCKIDELRINGVCKCKQNYYKSGQNQCIQCPPNSFFDNYTNKCECGRNFKFNVLTNSCVVDCPLNMVLNSQKKQCVCRQKFGLVNGVCQECKKQEGGYLAFGKCFYCAGNMVFLGTECGCQENHILGLDNICRSCRMFETPFNNTCQCFYPYVRNIYNNMCEKVCTVKQIKLYGQCIDCPPYSFNNGRNICQCEQQFVLVQSKCIPINRTCVDGTYKVNSSCIECPTSTCAKCDNNGICTACLENYLLGPDFQCRSICGDRKIFQPREECDDGNRISGDGCDQNCKKQPGYICFGVPTFCLSICGNGLITRYENCDDGNKNDGDGCSSKCNIEAGFSCFGIPSQCIRYNPVG